MKFKLALFRIAFFQRHCTGQISKLSKFFFFFRNPQEIVFYYKTLGHKLKFYHFSFLSETHKYKIKLPQKKNIYLPSTNKHKCLLNTLSLLSSHNLNTLSTCNLYQQYMYRHKSLLVCKLFFFGKKY